MAEAIDNLGRKIDTSNMTLGQIRDLIATCCVGPQRPLKEGEATSETQEKIKEIMGRSSQFQKDKKCVEDTADAYDELFDHSEKGFKKLKRHVDELTTSFGKVQEYALGFQGFAKLTKGIVDEERKFTQEVRAVAYETAGVTKISRGLQKTYEDIGRSVKQTGFDRSEFQKSYMTALKGGIKNQKAAMSITTAQLNTEKQLGFEAGSLGDQFKEWTLAGNMTVGQIADMGRGMRDVARSTGVTGEALKSGITSGQEFVNQLRNAAQLSATAAKNAMELAVNAQKFGVNSQMQPLMKAMASSSNLLLESSSETKTILFQAAGSVGRLDDLMKGTLLRSKQGTKDMAKGFENILSRFGVSSMEAIDQLSDSAKMQINLQMKASMGVELGEFRQQYQTLIDSSKTYADRLSDIDKKRKQNLTLEEKATLMEEERSLKTSKSLEVLTVLDEAAKGAKDMNQALGKFGERRKEFQEDLSAMGISATDNAGVARQAIRSALENVNVGLQKAGKSELKIDSSEIEKALKDPASMRELTAKITKGEQELATAQKAQLDPITQTNQYLQESNEYLRSMSQSLQSMAMNLPGASYATTALAGIGAATGLIGAGFETADFFKTFYRTTFGGQKEDYLGRPMKDKDSGEPIMEKGIFGIAKDVLGSWLGGEKYQTWKTKKTQIEKKMLPQEKKNLVQETKNVKMEKKVVEGEKTPCPSLPSMECFDLETLKKHGKQFASTAAALAILGIGILTLGAAMMWLSKKILSVFKLDTATVVETSTAVAAIIIGAAGIIGAALLAYEGMKKFENVKIDLGKAAKLFTKSAGVILLLGGALTLLGAAVVKLSQGILGAFGLDAATGKKVADDVSGILMSTAQIVLAVVLATGALMGIGALLSLLTGPQLGYALLFMGLGTAAILTLTPAIVGLAAATVTLAEAVMSSFSMDVQKANKVSENVSGIIEAASKIAFSIVKSVPLLSGFSALLPIAPLVSFFMLAGVSALGTLTFPILAFVRAVTKFSQIVGMIVNPRKAAEMADGIANVLKSCVNVAEKIIETKNFLSAITGRSWAQWAYESTQLWRLVAKTGVPALNEMKRPVIDFILAIKSFAKEVSSKVKIDEATRNARMVASVLKSTSSVAQNIVETKGSLSAIKGRTWLEWAGKWGEWGYLLRTTGVKALQELSPGIIEFIKEIKSFARNVAKEISPKEAIINSMGVAMILNATNKAAKKIIETSQLMSELKGFGWGKWFAESTWLGRAFTKVGGPALKQLAPGIIDFIKEIVNFCNDLEKVVSMEDAIKNSIQVSYILRSVANISKNIISITESMKNIKTGGWGQLLTNSINFAMGSTTGAEALKILRYPIIKYVEQIIILANSMRGLGDIKEASSIIRSVSILSSNTAILIKGLANATDLMTNSWSFFSKTPMQKIYESKDRFKIMFEGISQFMKQGIIDPVIQNLAGVDINSAAKIMISMAKMASSMIPLIRGLSYSFGMMSGGKLADELDTNFPIDKIVANKEMFRNHFVAIAEFMRDGIITPITENMPDISEIQESTKILEAMSRQLSALSNVIKKTSAVSNSLNRGIGGGLNINGISMGQLDTISSQFQAQNAGISDKVRKQSQNAKQIQNTDRQTKSSMELANAALRGEGIKVRDRTVSKAVEIQNKTQLKAKSAISSAMGDPVGKSALEAVKGKAKKRTWYEYFAGTEGTAKPQTKVSASTYTNANAPDLQNAVAKSRATTAPTKAEMVSPELGNIAGQTSEQTVLQQKLVNLFEQVLDVLTPKSTITSTSAGQPCDDNKVGNIRTPAKYYRSNTGLVTRQPSRGIINS